VGEVREAFGQALEGLRKRSSFGRVSSLFRSHPIGPPQPDFLNAAVAIAWPHDLLDLLALTRALERAALRRREVRWGPRTLDLDILWAGSRTARTSSLIVPHPRLLERRFALEPLVQILPDAADPLTGRSLARTLLSLENQPLTVVQHPPW